MFAVLCAEVEEHCAKVRRGRRERRREKGGREGEGKGREEGGGTGSEGGRGEVGGGERQGRRVGERERVGILTGNSNDICSGKITCGLVDLLRTTAFKAIPTATRYYQDEE